MTKNVLYYGREEPLPEQVPLRAGPLSLVYEDGDLRYIRLGDREIVRRIYASVRDRNWGTVPPRPSNVRREVAHEGFRIMYDVENRQGEIDFFWKGTITGDARGTIRFTMEGEARSTFWRIRIGFCVLHPIRECPGQPCRVEKADGSMEEGTFPQAISAHQPFKDMQAISHEIVPGVWAEVRFTGDIFEMEDQRNWTDASYKTYCTPLALPFPVEVKQGTRITQSVTLTVNGVPVGQPVPQPDTGLTFSLRPERATSLPRLGLGMASHDQPLSQTERARLKALNLSHLRVDLHLSQTDCPAALRRATAESRALGVPLEAALFLSDAAEAELKSLATELEQIRPAVWVWLIFHAGEKSTTERWIRLAREHLTAYDPNARIGGGTNAYFTELNRGRPPVEALDLVCYSINPQVHAFDNASLVETLEAQASTVVSARQFIGDRPLAITPITLKPRSNPDATGPEPEPAPGELPRAVDVRQMSLFGAGWTVGSLKYLSSAGVGSPGVETLVCTHETRLRGLDQDSSPSGAERADSGGSGSSRQTVGEVHGVYSTTYYETTGWCGVMETEAGSPVPDRFRSLPGGVFPLYHVLADVGEFAGGEVLSTTSSSPLQVDGLALQKEGRTRVILASFSPEPRRVTVQGLEGTVQVRSLDETNAEEAMRSPEAFRVRAGDRMRASGGKLEIELLPFAVARIDVA